MDAEILLDRVQARYDGIVRHETWGERALCYNPDGYLPRGTYVLTLKERNGDNDRASELTRPDVYRVSFGLSAAGYRERFGEPPTRPPKGGVVDTGHDFATLGELVPHPVYAWAGWVCALSPSDEAVEALWPVVDEAYERAVAAYESRRLKADA